MMLLSSCPCLMFNVIPSVRTMCMYRAFNIHSVHHDIKDLFLDQYFGLLSSFA